jgi:putative flippase GtrA
MKMNKRRALEVFARFFIAGGLTKAIDAWIVSLDLAWQLSVAACLQFVAALALTYLIDQAKEESASCRSDRKSSRRRRRAA